MGAYIYSLRSPALVRKVAVVTPSNQRIIIEHVGSVSYAYKPHGWDSEGRDRHAIQAIERMEKVWDNQSRRPMCAAVTNCDDRHSIKVGQRVFAYRHGTFDSKKIGQINYSPIIRQYPMSVCDETVVGFGKCLGIIVSVADKFGRVNKDAPIPAAALRDWEIMVEIHQFEKKKAAEIYLNSGAVA